MIHCPKCNGPVRFVGERAIPIDTQRGMTIVQVVGAECHDEKCRGNVVVPSDVWMVNLREVAP